MDRAAPYQFGVRANRRGFQWPACFAFLLAACASASQSQPVPDVLQMAEKTHTEIHKKLSLAVVGLICKGKLPNGQPGQYYGTGTVISAEGLLLTGATVIPPEATEIKVYFTDGTVRAAKTVKSDPSSEGVLLQVEGQNFTHMRLADSTKYKVGDPVYSWGNPHFTIQQDGTVSLSLGTISGLYNVSSSDDQSRYAGPVLETDAAVNPGSDGGPLTDAEGNLLGVLSFAFSRTRWLGSAIPTARLLEGLPELKPLGFVARPTLDGPRTQVWAYRQAFAELSEAVAQSVVAVWVVREGDKWEAPEQRNQETLRPYTPVERSTFAAQEVKRPLPSIGSGLIVDREGTVLTSLFHLGGKEAIKKIWVFLPDGSKVEATQLGKDNFYGVAALKFDPQGRKFGSSELVAVGAWAPGHAVAVLGRSEPPGGLTVNSGSVSAVSRWGGDYLQISALINYGNLGGPVLDLSGQVVGVSVRLGEATPWRQNCGVGFMLRAEKIAKILPDLKAGKTVEHPPQPHLGVQVDFGVLDIKGGRVALVAPNSPAAAAGLQTGDIVLEFDGKLIADGPALVAAIRAAKVDQTIKLKVKRGNEEKTFEVKVGRQEQ